MIEFLQNYHLAGIVIGLCTFLVIGLFHPLVIKGEYISVCVFGGRFLLSELCADSLRGGSTTCSGR